MGSNQDWGMGEKTFQRMGLVHQHIARAASHENLNTTNCIRIHFFDFFQIVIGSTQIK